MIDERQMSLFEEGGMTAPEVEVDAASGNEIPPGSLPEEVRDDVDAKLSSGEYVVPADVLRYYGMKFFEDLRKRAKDELSEMDAEGRIGGEPTEDDEEDSDGLSEQEMELLRQVMSEGGEEQEFNQGGLVFQNPEFYPKPQFAEGGMTSKPSFNARDWATSGSSYFGASSSSGAGASVGSYYKTYVGPNNETRLILFVNGEPTTPIPEGFKEQKNAASELQEDQAKEEVVRDNSESEQRAREAQEDTEDSKSWAETNYEEVTKDPIAFGLEQLKGGFLEKIGGQGARIGGALAGVPGALMGGIAGAGIALENVAAARAASLQAKSQGLDTTTLDKEIEKYVSGLSPAARFMDGLGLASGEKRFEALSGVKPLDQTEAAFSSVRSGTGGGGFAANSGEAESRAREIAADFGGDGDSNSEVRTEQARTTEGTVSTIGGTGEGNAGVSVRSGSAAPTQSSRPQGRPDRTQMSKGGLVKRRQKKTKK